MTESVKEKSNNLCSTIVSRLQHATIFRARTFFSPPLLPQQSIGRRPKNIFSASRYFPSNNFRPQTSYSEMFLHHLFLLMPTNFSQQNLPTIKFPATLRINLRSPQIRPPTQNIIHATISRLSSTPGNTLKIRSRPQLFRLSIFIRQTKRCNPDK